MKKTNIRRSKPFLLCMYVTILTCDFGVFDDDMVVSLTRLTLSDVENASKISFSMAYLECVSGGRKFYRCCCVMI